MNTINDFTLNTLDKLQEQQGDKSDDHEDQDDNTSELKYKKLEDIDVKNIITRIGKLNTKEKLHILNILRMTNIEYTKNSNGFFFNLLDINEDILEKIFKCLDLIEKNSGILKEMDRRRTELLTYYKNLIEERLNKNVQKKRDEYFNRLHLKEYPMNFVIKRKNRINRKRLFENITDPDLLIKEYNKSKNRFEKGSVYHRIITSIKFIKSNRSREIKTTESDEMNILDGNTSDYDNQQENESVVDITEDSFHMSDNEEEKEDSEKQEEDDLKEDEDLDEKDEIEEEYESDNEIEEEFIVDKITTSEENAENEFRRFKNLLHQQGFEFNDNKNCMLVYQTYIS